MFLILIGVEYVRNYSRYNFYFCFLNLHLSAVNITPTYIIKAVVLCNLSKT